MNRDGFIFYKSFYEASKYLDDGEKGRLFDMICQYGLYGNEIKGKGAEMGMFLLIKPQLDANNKRYINGCKGGAPEGNQNAVKNWGNDIKQPKNNQKQPKDKDKDNVKDKIKDKEKIIIDDFQQVENISLPKQEENKTTADLTFDKIYQNYYRKCGHKVDIPKFKKAFDSMGYNQEQLEKILIDELIFKIEYKYGIKDQQYRPKFDTYITSLNLDDMLWDDRLMRIAKWHMDNVDEKMSIRNDDIMGILGGDLSKRFEKYCREYIRNKNKITLKLV